MRAINLLPVEERAGARTAVARRTLNGWHGIAAVGALVVVALLGAWAMARGDAADAREAAAAAVARGASAQAQVDRLAPVVALDARRQSREASVVALANGRTDWAGVLRAVAGALPRQVSLTTLGLQAAGAGGTTTGTTGSGATAPAGLQGTGTVTVAACADTQPRVATTLRALRMLPQVEDVALNQTSRTKGADTTPGAAAGATGCPGVSVDAAVGLSAASLLDAVRGGDPGAAAPGAGTAGATGTAPAGDQAAAAATAGTSR
jgi:Tfp pilus assembly protein PilN